MPKPTDETITIKKSTLRIVSHTVEVVDVQWRSETYVSSSSSGGGGMVYGGTGYISAGTTHVSSSTHSWQHAVVKYPNGTEQGLDINKDFTLRPGHTLTLYWIEDEANAWSHLIRVYNTNTNIICTFDTPRQLKRIGFMGHAFFQLLWAFILFIVISAAQTNLKEWMRDNLAEERPAAPPYQYELFIDQEKYGLYFEALPVVAGFLIVFFCILKPLISIIRHSRRRSRERKQFEQFLETHTA